MKTWWSKVQDIQKEIVRVAAPCGVSLRCSPNGCSRLLSGVEDVCRGVDNGVTVRLSRGVKRDPDIRRVDETIDQVNEELPEEAGAMQGASIPLKQKIWTSRNFCRLGIIKLPHQEGRERGRVASLRPCGSDRSAIARSSSGAHARFGRLAIGPSHPGAGKR